jgi:hypothetical protein
VTRTTRQRTSSNGSSAGLTVRFVGVWRTLGGTFDRTLYMGTAPFELHRCGSRTPSFPIRNVIRITFHGFLANHLVLSTIVYLTQTRHPRYPEPQTWTIYLASIQQLASVPPARSKNPSILEGRVRISKQMTSMPILSFGISPLF